MPICFLCKETEISVNGLLIHFNIKHNASLFTIFKCGENGCYRKWSSWNSLRKHLLGPNHNFPAWSFLKKHPEHIEFNNNIQNCKEFVNNNRTTNSDMSLQEVTVNRQLTLTEFKCLITDHSNAFVAKLYNKPSIPRNYIQSIIEDSTILINSHVSILKEKVVSILIHLILIIK